MQTPICDFVRRYCESDPLRLHMPGHKGAALLGFEGLDVTEIDGADSLYEADGIILESERNAGALFGCKTLYSTEGSSLCIRAMLHLALLHARETSRKPLIAAGRNAHKSFLSAAALLGLDIHWLVPEEADSYLSCKLDAAALEEQIARCKPVAVYVTSPDYLGNVVDIAAIARACHRQGALLIVDNAHGAYLRFLPGSLHPIDLGADLCCDSAHKTLPVLTGGAYLHLSDRLPKSLAQQARDAMALFGSTSPSYLILQSLDACNHYLADGYPERLAGFVRATEAMKARLRASGFALRGDEALKLTIAAKGWGYSGYAMAATLMEQNIAAEFADPDFIVCMLTPEIGTAGLLRLEKALTSLPRRPEIALRPPEFHMPRRRMAAREAALSPREVLPVEECVGRVLAMATVGCPPAVPIVACGEEIDVCAAECLRYYGIERCRVVKA